MTQAKSGDKVQVHYTGTLDDGTVFDSSSGREPLEFTIGEKQVIAGFEDAVVGMEKGQKTTTKIAVDQAYGQRREEMVVQVPREKLPDGLEPKVGDRLQVGQPDGRQVAVTVTEISETTLTLDGNHPLAGQALTFEIELVGVA